MALDRHIPTDGGHTFHIWIEHASSGWDVREELDQTVVRVEHYNDWHRVERAMTRFETEARKADISWLA